MLLPNKHKALPPHSQSAVHPHDFPNIFSYFEISYKCVTMRLTISLAFKSENVERITSEACNMSINNFTCLQEVIPLLEGIMSTNESAENYLETILILSKTLPVVRSVDVATELGYKKSSVSIAMKNLREKEHITVSDAGYITLTKTGREIAEMIYERHEVFKTWLTTLGVDEQIASEDACKMEHAISKESFEAIKAFITNN